MKHTKTMAIPVAAAVAASAATAALMGISHAQTTPATGKVGPWDAIKAATAKVPGKALYANYEFDEGKWGYDVMIAHGKSLTEVEIDPMTGKVGDTETVTPAGEAKELQSDLSKAIGQTAAAKSTEKEKD